MVKYTQMLAEEINTLCEDFRNQMPVIFIKANSLFRHCADQGDAKAELLISDLKELENHALGNYHLTEIDSYYHDFISGKNTKILVIDNKDIRVRDIERRYFAMIQEIHYWIGRLDKIGQFEFKVDPRKRYVPGDKNVGSKSSA